MPRVGFAIALLASACGDDGAPAGDAPPVTDDAPTSALVFEPPVYDFGDVDTAAVTGPQTTFVVRNSSTVAATIDAVAIAGGDAAEFSVLATSCAGELAPGATCEVAVGFAPRVASSRSSSVQVTGSVTASALVGGRGTSRQRIAIEPSARNLGDIPAGEPSPPFVFQIRNATGAATTIAPTVTGASFAIASNTCTSEVAIDATCEIGVVFTPPTGGEFVGGLELRDASNRTYAAGLVGTSSTPFAIAPFSDLFSSMLVGQAQPGDRRTFTIQNTTDTTSGALAASLVGPDAASFVIRTNGCTAALPEDATCQVVVEFAPSTRGNKGAQLEVRDTASGKAIRGALRGSAYTFLAVGGPHGNSPVGQAKVVTIDVLNASGVATGTPAVSIGGPDAGQFAIVASTCNAAIGAHSKCTVDVRFTPSSVGMKAATLHVSGTPGGSDAHALSGTGI